MVNGRQNKTAFMTAANDLQQKLQQIINETASGYYNGASGFVCTGSMTATVHTVPVDLQPFSASSSGCIFVGKALRFGAASGPTSSGGNTSLLMTYPLVGYQYQSPSTEVQDYKSTWPVAVAPSASNPSLPDGLSYTAQNGLNYKWTRASDGVTAAGSVIAFMTTFGSYSGGSLSSGSQQLQLYQLTGSSAGMTGYYIADSIHASNVAFAPVSDDLKVCYNSGTTKQHVTYTIGETSGNLSVTSQIANGDCPS